MVAVIETQLLEVVQLETIFIIILEQLKQQEKVLLLILNLHTFVFLLVNKLFNGGFKNGI